MLLATDPKTGFDREALWLRIVPSVAVMAALVVVTFWAWQAARNTLRNEEERATQAETQQIQQAIDRRLSLYEEILRGGAALVSGAEQLTPAQWDAYVSTFQLDIRFPGSQGIGYLQLVAPQELEEHLSRWREIIGPGYSIQPAGERPLYAPVVLISPLNERNQRAVGFDAYSEPSRRWALETARDANDAILTPRINLIQNDPGEMLPGFAMILPVYAQNAPLASVSDRQKAISGYINAAFDSGDFFASILSREHNLSSGFRIYDSRRATAANLLFESPRYRALQEDRQALGNTALLSIYGREWTLDAYSPADIISSAARNRPHLILFAGLSASLLLTIVVYLLLSARVRLLSRTREREIQTAKDELLSLASHQLRTPATAVKQFLGMLREGYEGDLTVGQQQLIHKAYKSNERQIKIVNEMLYVANADAGKLRLYKKPVSLNQIINEAVDEQRELLEERDHKLRIVMPSEEITLSGDELFLRMAIGNILSNAIKYTPSKGRIVIRASQTLRSVRVSVKDNGVGIKESQKPLLFKKFTRLENSLTAETVGSGLGLYLAKKLVELHGGRLSVSSAPRKGTLITIRLPRQSLPGMERINITR